VTAVPETDEFDNGEAVARVAQPRQLIVTVYGLYSRRESGWLSVATLIGLLADLGVDESAVRSSISRLKRRGILEAIRRDGTAGYELSEQALAILREGDHRIFQRKRATPADGWLLAVFSVPEAGSRTPQATRLAVPADEGCRSTATRTAGMRARSSSNSTRRSGSGPGSPRSRRIPGYQGKVTGVDRAYPRTVRRRARRAGVREQIDVDQVQHGPLRHLAS
jgi:hypothetical protein